MAKKSSLWMRYVRFDKVKDLLHLVCENNGELNAGKLESLGIEKGILIKDNGQPLGRYRRYNYRKALENLGIAKVNEHGRYWILPDSRILRFLQITETKKSMPSEAREILRTIIVENGDCRRYFFDAFMGAGSSYTLEDLRRKGEIVQVVTRSMQVSPKTARQQVILRSSRGNAIELSTSDEINAVYWGVRSWAIDLEITDEVMTGFDDGRIIYPINPDSSKDTLRQILLRMMRDKNDSNWSLIHIPTFIKESALISRLPVKSIKRFLRCLKDEYPRLVMLVPSSTAFIDIKTPFEKQDTAIRNSYLYEKGRGYISHLRVREDVRKEVHAMSRPFIQEKYKLSRNPFPPAASGVDVINVKAELYVPATWEKSIERYYSELSRGSGAKAFPVIGEYGTGKTVLLKGCLSEFFEGKRIKTFYFENPGVQFYDLANTLMRNLGRYEFAKALWERCKEYLQERGQMSLFPKSFGDMLSELRNRRDRENRARELQVILKDNLSLTNEDEIAGKLALLIVETASKPYFEYRDFVAGLRGSLVAENEEPKYFKAVIKAIMEIYSVEGVAFLIDEFEEVAISKRMTRGKIYEYLATLRHLIDISEDENVWIIMAMTPQAGETTREMNPALWDRFTHERETTLELTPLSKEESKGLLIWWLNRARESEELREYRNTLYPFPKQLLDLLDTSPDFMLPRKLVKLGFRSLARAERENVEPPIPAELINEILEEFHPKESMGAATDGE